MSDKIDPKDKLDYKELSIANMIEVQALAELLIEKGVISKQEYFNRIKQIQMDGPKTALTPDFRNE